MALEGQVLISESYLDRVHLVGYPMTSTDASIKISELWSSDTGVYRCEVQHGIEDNHDIVHVQVQGMKISSQSQRKEIPLSIKKCFPLIGCQIFVGVVYKVSLLTAKRPHLEDK